MLTLFPDTRNWPLTEPVPQSLRGAQQLGAAFPHVGVHGFELKVGKARISAPETPHTPESVCLVITDEDKFHPGLC